jgi:hypothetical protein
MQSASNLRAAAEALVHRMNFGGPTQIPNWAVTNGNGNLTQRQTFSGHHHRCTVRNNRYAVGGAGINTPDLNGDRREDIWCCSRVKTLPGPVG